MKRIVTLILSFIIVIQCGIIVFSANTFTTGTYKITATALRMRKGPSTSYDVLSARKGGTKYIYENEIVYVEKTTNNWGYVSNHDDVSGWICLDYADKIDLSQGTPYDNSTETDIKKAVIDVSEWNGLINWSKVKNDNIWGAVIRIGRTSSENPDTSFEYNYYNAVANGIQTGCYYYCYAKTTEKAKADAQRVIKFLKSKNYIMTLPIYYDVEDDYIKNLSNDLLTDIAYTFCKTLKDAGYMAGVYCNRSWATTKLNMNKLSDFEVWIAEWNKTCAYKGSYKMWQYADNGNISGIDESYCDLDWCYLNYPYIIRQKGLNGLSLPVKEEVTSDIYTNEEKTPIESLIINQTAATNKSEETTSADTSNKQQNTVGDINSDEKINIKDARLLLQFCAKTINFTTSQKTVADTNNDGLINIKDARHLLRVIAKLENL